MFQFESYLQFSGMFALYIGIPAGLISLILLIAHSIRLSRKLDNCVFNENHFNEYELNIYQSFPLNLIKTIAYQAGIVFPDIMRKRFKEIKLRNKVSQLDIFLSFISVILIVLAPLSFIHLIFVFFITN